MIYGIEVNRAYCKSMSEFHNTPIEKITEADMARVAKGLKGKYQDQAEKRLAELKGDFGVGVCSLIRLYNATGATLTVKDTVDFRGHIGAQPIEHNIPNGCWTVFIHVKTAIVAAGSAGAVVLRHPSGQEFFAGWQNPWTRGDSQVWAETFGSGHWWSVASKSLMFDLLDDHNGQRHEHTYGGYHIVGITGNNTTAYIEFVCEKV
ncbi:hypothetical protein C8F01DRAFT_1312062 [Mycena amicta]|nr:hypothetical protein C8F01DRAFT_1312062 [Mycena amicta]